MKGVPQPNLGESTDAHILIEQAILPIHALCDNLVMVMIVVRGRKRNIFLGNANIGVRMYFTVTYTSTGLFMHFVGLKCPLLI